MGHETWDLGLNVQGLRKAFRLPSGENLEVLRGVSLSARAGEMLAVVGASGAGKSTLLHLLGGLEAADAGSVRLGGFELSEASGAGLARFRNESVGFVFQFHHLLPDLTALENVALPLLISRAAWPEALARAGSLLERFGPAGRGADKVGSLSGGEQQRLAVARALIKEPGLVLADEPTGNLDQSNGDEINAILRDFCQRHQAIVVIATHNARLASACHRTLRLHEGKLEEV